MNKFTFFGAAIAFCFSISCSTSQKMKKSTHSRMKRSVQATHSNKLLNPLEMSDQSYLNHLKATTEEEYQGIFDLEGRKIKYEVDKIWSGHYRDFKLTYTSNFRYEIADTTKSLTALVFCHELGHIIGGPPFSNYQGLISSEGEADYYAGVDCLRRVFKRENNQLAIRGINFPVKIVDRCKKVSSDIDMCLRIAYAAFLFTRTWDTDDSEYNGVRSLHDQYLHPRRECRFSTYLAGAMCNRPAINFSRLLVNERQKATSRYDLLEGRNYCPNEKEAERPKCWYNPGFLPIVQIEINGSPEFNLIGKTSKPGDNNLELFPNSKIVFSSPQKNVKVSIFNRGSIKFSEISSIEAIVMGGKTNDAVGLIVESTSEYAEVKWTDAGRDIAIFNKSAQIMIVDPDVQSFHKLGKNGIEFHRFPLAKRWSSMPDNSDSKGGVDIFSIEVDEADGDLWRVTENISNCMKSSKTQFFGNIQHFTALGAKSENNTFLDDSNLFRECLNDINAPLNMIRLGLFSNRLNKKYGYRLYEIVVPKLK